MSSDGLSGVVFVMFVMPVLGTVMLGGLVMVMLGLHMMAVRYMGVMAGLLVIAGFVVLGGQPVVLGSVFMMLGCFSMMLSGVIRHGNPRF